MYQSSEQFVAVNKCANAALASAKRITTLNFNAARAALEHGTSNTKALLATRDAAALPSSLVQPSVELAVKYSRSVCGVAVEIQNQFTKQIEVQFSDIQRQVMAVIKQTAKQAPGRSEAAAAAVKSVFAMANSAFESMDIAAQQFAGVSERNVITAGDGSVAVVGKE